MAREGNKIVAFAIIDNAIQSFGALRNCVCFRIARIVLVCYFRKIYELLPIRFLSEYIYARIYIYIYMCKCIHIYIHIYTPTYIYIQGSAHLVASPYGVASTSWLLKIIGLFCKRDQ